MIPSIRTSSLDRLLGCNGSPTLIAVALKDAIDTGDEGGSWVTWRGNWCHWRAAVRLVEEHGALTDGPIPLPNVPASFKPTKWDELLVEWYLVTLLGLTPPDHVFHVERELVWRNGRFELTGHIDVFSISPSGEEIQWNDLKTGLVEVDQAELNWQIGGYGALLKIKYPNVKRGTARIFQRHADQPVSEVEIDDMDRIVPFMFGKISEALDRPYHISTGKYCGYCPAILFCPAIRKEIEEMEMILTKAEVEALTAVPDIKELGVLAQRVRLLSSPLEKIVEGFRERLAKLPGGNLVLPNGTIARLTVEPGRRTITSTKAAFDLASTKVDPDALWEAMSMSITALEDVLHEHGGMKRTSKTEESAQSFIRGSMKHLMEQGTVTKLKFLA